MMSSTVIGFYRCKDDDGNYLYCYVTKSPSGKINYYFTKDSDEAASMAAKFCNSNNYNKNGYRSVITAYPDSFNLNCKDVDEVLERIKRANPDEKIKEDDFDDAIDDYDKDETGFFARVKERISNSKFGTKVKNLWFNKKVRRFAIGAVATLTALGIASCSLNSCSGPTANNSKVATVDDTDKDTLDDDTKEDVSIGVADAIGKMVDEIKNMEKAAQKEETQVASAGSANTSSTTGTNNSNNSQGSSSSNHVDREPGTVDNSMNGFQNPDASLDDSNNQGGDSGEETEQPENPYDNMTEEEVPVDNNGNSEDEDYSQEIDVGVAGDDELTEGDIDFDEGYENDPSVDDDYTYDINYDTDNSSDYEIINEELPDPNQTAADGNYVSSEEEMNVQEEATNEESSEVTDTNTTDSQDVVPVYQEETDYTETSVPVTSTEETSNITTPSTTESSGTDLESAVDQAIEVMASGNDASITYDVSTGQYSTEVTTTNTNIEENGLTK